MRKSTPEPVQTLAQVKSATSYRLTKSTNKYGGSSKIGSLKPLGSPLPRSGLAHSLFQVHAKFRRRESWSEPLARHQSLLILLAGLRRLSE